MLINFVIISCVLVSAILINITLNKSLSDININDIMDVLYKTNDILQQVIYYKPDLLAYLIPIITINIYIVCCILA